MNFKKVLSGIFFAIITVMFFSSCDIFKQKEVPVATVSISRLDVVNPAEFEYFDIDFSVDMDTGYGASAFVYYNYAYEDTGLITWITPRKLRVYVYAKYSHWYKYVINDDSFLTSSNNSGSYTRENNYLRSTEGVFADSIEISFSTGSSGKTHPYDINIDLADVAPKEIYLHENYWKDKDGEQHLNQQVMINLKDALNHLSVRAGDIVKISFKIKSDKDISKLYCQLVDVSSNVNYWKKISTNEEDIVFAEDVKASTKDEEHIYEGVVTILVTEKLSAFDLVLQLWADCDAEDPYSSLITLQNLSN